MAEYLHPGVYVEEKSSGTRPIEGVSTSTAAFIGVTAKGVPNKATFITSWSQFVRKFGYLIPGSYLPYAVQQFFSNGGKRCYIVRVLSDAASKAATIDFPSQQISAARLTLRVSALGNGAWGNSLTVLVEDGSQNPTGEFKLVVLNDGEVVELFDNLSMDPGVENYVETEINGASDFIEVEDLHASTDSANPYATATSTDALANSAVFAVGDNVTIEGPDGTTNTVALPVTATPAEVVDALNTAWAAFNVAVLLTTAVDIGTVGRLRVRANAAGYQHYFRLSGTATAGGQPLAGLAGFAQGKGAALGATAKSAVGLSFDISVNNILSITINGDALPPITLIPDPITPTATPIAAILVAINGGLQGLASARREGNRLVIATTNLGNANSALIVGGTANTPLNFRQIDGTAIPGGGTMGYGRSEPAFIQSDEGPFTIEDGANFTLNVNNGALGAPSADIVISFTAAVFPNLQQVTAQQLVARITSIALAGTVTATRLGKRVVIRQTRSGNFYTLKLTDGSKSPNIKLNFDALTQNGYADGDAASPYFRPGFNLVANVNEPRALLNGTDGSPVTGIDTIGTADKKTGLHALDDVTDVNFLAIPGATDPAVVSAAVGYCGTRQDCFYIADAPGKRDKTTPVTDPAQVRDYMRNKVSPKNSYGALYYPWLEIADPVGPGKNPRRYVPPSGFIAGLYARIDNTRGVWKAAAGTEAGLIGAIGLEYSVTDAEQDILNPIGVNCVRQFPASGLVVWGARTFSTQSDPEYRYVPVRRYTIYLRQSIYLGTQWAVFEPNDAPLWATLKANIEDFMMGEFRKGALAGVTPEQAFDVKCDADLNPPSEVNAGRVNVEVAFAPLKPAEFVIIRISQKTQRPQS